MKKIPQITIFALLAFIICRGVSLELLDFSEPTEARYAAIAADMIHLKNWVTPQFPRGLDHEPYLGKPPLYFWLMAISQSLFGFDEWAARVPSFAAGILTAVGIFIAGSFCSTAVGLSAVLIWFGTAFVYFFSGAVMVDTTLTLFITTALVSFFVNYNSNYLANHLISGVKISFLKINFPQIIFWISISLGFLTKGPVAVIFSVLPIFAFMIVRKDYQILKFLFSPIGILLFFLISTPWFYYAELENPGFLKYFFYNENFLRFFVKNYGDRYGSGHRYPYGSALWMLFLGMLPWSLYFLRLIPNRKLIFREANRSLNLQFFLCWGLSIPLFLCFMKQLHPGYLIPAFPGLALCIGFLRETDASKKALNWDKIVRKTLNTLVVVTVIGVIGYASIKGITWGRLSVLAIFIFLGSFVLLNHSSKSWEKYSQLRRLSDLSLSVFFTFFCLTIVLSKEISESTSPSTMLRCIAANVNQDGPISVSFIGNRSYSIHYLNEAWDHELSRQIKFDLVPEPVPADAKLSDHIVVKEKYQASVPLNKYTRVDKVNKFIWFAKNGSEPKFPTRCESGIF